MADIGGVSGGAEHTVINKGGFWVLTARNARFASVAEVAHKEHVGIAAVAQGDCTAAFNSKFKQLIDLALQQAQVLKEGGRI